MLHGALAFLTCALLLAGVAGCGGDGRAEDKNVLQPDAGSAQARRSAVQASNELQKVLDAYAKVKTFRARLEVEGPGLPKQEGELEVVLPDRFRAKYPPSAGQPGLEVILIGSDTYFKNGETWSKQSAPQGATPLSAAGVQSTVQSLLDAGAEKDGSDSVNGKKCQSYSAKGMSGNQELCVADSLPLRYSLETGGVKTTLTFNDYDKDIEIKPPI